MNYMNHSLATADRSTHLKIVVVALLGAMTVAGVGVTARIANSDMLTARIQADGPVIKAGKPMAVTSTTRDVTIR